jgi:hypothetical protein
MSEANVCGDVFHDFGCSVGQEFFSARPLYSYSAPVDFNYLQNAEKNFSRLRACMGLDRRITSGLSKSCDRPALSPHPLSLGSPPVLHSTEGNISS